MTEEYLFNEDMDDVQLNVKYKKKVLTVAELTDKALSSFYSNQFAKTFSDKIIEIEQFNDIQSKRFDDELSAIIEEAGSNND